MSGTTTRIQHSVDPNNNLITQQPTTYDLSSPAGGQTYDPSGGMYVSEFTYTPTGSNTIVYTGGMAKTNMMVRTRVQWVSTSGNPAPSEVTLVIEGHATAVDPTPAGRGANDGLGHDAVESPERPGRTSKASGGKRYRKFKVGGNGKVEFMTQLYAEVSMSGTGGSGTEDCSFSVRPADLAVSVTSDKDGTFRRVMKGDGPHQVSNYLEDDEVTSRGGDGQGYGDSAAVESDRDGRSFASRFTLYTSGFGTWGFGYDISISSSAKLSGGGDGADWILGGYQYGQIPDSPAKPLKTFTVTGWASDRSSGISDTYTYNMRVHLKAQKEEPLGTFNADYLYWANQDARFADFNSAGFMPECPFSFANPGGQAEKYQITSTKTVTSESGWTANGGGSLELDVKIAKIIFNGTFSRTYSGKDEATKSIQGDIVVNPGQRYELWRCPAGMLEKHATSLWGDHGYQGDGRAYVISSYRDVFQQRRRPASTPLDGPPHMGQN